jgi:D-glycero-alpha-D-manno-heptose 1-phosphate guanylyltransferase
METIILAGGFGTRLQSVVKDVPKPMAEVNGYPFLKYLFDYLKIYDIKKVILSVGYKQDIIKEYFKNSYLDIEIIYSSEDEPLGTGGAIKRALSFSNSDKVFILNGDTYFKIDLNKMLNRHIELNADITIATKNMQNFDRYGKVQVENNRIIKFEEKKFNKDGLINGGIYVINKDIFNNFDLKERFSFESDFLQKYINELNIINSTFDEYFIDIGIPEDYKKAQIEMA